MTPPYKRIAETWDAKRSFTRLPAQERTGWGQWRNDYRRTEGSELSAGTARINDHLQFFDSLNKGRASARPLF